MAPCHSSPVLQRNRRVWTQGLHRCARRRHHSFFASRRPCSSDWSLHFIDFRTGERFPREYFLVRGEDRANRGFRRAPWEDGVGFTGDAEVDLVPHAQAEALTRRKLGWLKDGGRGGKL